MTEFLVFQLYSPLVSWGDVAIGEVRQSFVHPSKSAVLGLIAGSLGIRRDEEAKLGALRDSLTIAMRLDASGSSLRDYHSAQVPVHSRARDRATRKDEIEYGPLTTILTSRDYRTDSLSTIAVRMRPERNDATDISLTDIAHALNHPIFAPFLGRKACPPALPMEAQTLQANNWLDAFTQAKFETRSLLSMLTYDKKPRVFWDFDDGSLQALHQTVRWDEPANRARWQFEPRTEFQGVIPENLPQGE